jgi:hypothetical protein
LAHSADIFLADYQISRASENVVKGLKLWITRQVVALFGFRSFRRIADELL